MIRCCCLRSLNPTFTTDVSFEATVRTDLDIGDLVYSYNASSKKKEYSRTSTSSSCSWDGIKIPSVYPRAHFFVNVGSHRSLALATILPAVASLPMSSKGYYIEKGNFLADTTFH
jgi:hypothetical protein